MTTPSASGERSALRGYRVQYDHVAALVYTAILDGDFVRLRLADDEAGQADDCVLHRRSGIHAYQYKSSDTSATLTGNVLTRVERATEDRPGRTAIQSMAAAWKALGGAESHVVVHYVTSQPASSRDHLAKPEDANRPGQDNFAVFLREVMEPIRQGDMEVKDVPAEWAAIFTRFVSSIELPPEELQTFLRHLEIETRVPYQRWDSADVPNQDRERLAGALWRRVSESDDTVDLDLDALLALVGWSDRPRLRSAHEFPVDLEAYAPLDSAIGELDAVLSACDTGYVAVLGPPGSGKSTLLAQTMSGTSDRVVRYFAFIPGSPSPTSRLTAPAFLHDLVLLLQSSGLTTAGRSLPSLASDDARQQFTDLIDAAAAEYLNSRRRTIVVIDGLDHVQRDRPLDGLLQELLPPESIPPGVLFVIGSRTLDPLPTSAHQQAAEDDRVIDLANHRMSPEAVLTVCRRAAVTRDLPDEIHQEVVHRVDGHPLTLGYILNSLAENGDVDASDVIARVPAYGGDIATGYASLWAAEAPDANMERLLGVVSRLRVPFTTAWLLTWNDARTVERFRRRFSFLFRTQHDGLGFFHESFRQYTADRTAGADFGTQTDPAIEQALHRDVAELLSASDAPTLKAEELYHRWVAGDTQRVVDLAHIDAFRAQIAAYRALDDVIADVLIALESAASLADVPAITRCLLMLMDLNFRQSILRDLDVPATLYRAGLADEAIRFVGSPARRRVEVDQKYNLARLLGIAGDGAGAAIFVAAEADELSEPRSHRAGRDNDVAVAWARCAPLYRPWERIWAKCVGVLENYVEAEEDYPVYGNRPERFVKMVTGIATTLSEVGDHHEGLKWLADRLAEAAALYHDDVRERSDDASAYVTHARLLVHLRHRELTRGTSTDPLTQHFLDSLRGSRVLVESRLTLAELLCEVEDFDGARTQIDGYTDRSALSASDLGYSSRRGLSVQDSFRAWRVRHAVALSEGADHLLESEPPPADRPAGADISESASSHDDVAAIAMAARVDRAVRVLAHVDANVAAGVEQTSWDIASMLIPLLEVFNATEADRHSNGVSGIRQHRQALLTLIVDVAGRHSPAALRQVVDVINARRSTDTSGWSPSLLVDLARTAARHGIPAPWLGSALADWETMLADEDIYERVESLAKLATAHAALGNTDDAKRLAASIGPYAFGVGYRKDYQFHEWIPWLGRGISETPWPAPADDIRLVARLVAATEPQTEGGPGRAAADLPAYTATASPLAGVRVFEFLVGHGACSHFPTLSRLAATLAGQLQGHELASLALAGDILTDIVSAGSMSADADAATTLREASLTLLGNSDGSTFCQTLAGKTDMYALGSTRSTWRAALTGEPEPASPGAAEADNSAADETADADPVHGERIDDAMPVSDLARLREREQPDSRVQWHRVVERRQLCLDEIQTLAPLFKPDSREGPQTLAVLAEQAERLGDNPLASRLAHQSLQAAADRSHSWSKSYAGGTRRRAAAVITRVEPEGLCTAASDLAAEVRLNPYTVEFLVNEMGDLLEALDPDATGSKTWPEARTYLEGMLPALNLPEEDPLGPRGPLWWLPSASTSSEPDPTDSTSNALAELAVRHLTHATWTIREGALRVVVRALRRGDVAVAEALSRLSRATDRDETLELIGRCLDGSATGLTDEVEQELAPVRDHLHSRPAVQVCGLAAEDPVVSVLPARYDLQLPPHPVGPGQEAPWLAPFEPQLRELADFTGIDVRTLFRVASDYAQAHVDQAPRDQDVTDTLEAATSLGNRASARIWGARTAFGRVVGDLLRAGRLHDAPRELLRELTMCDPSVLGCDPDPRPPFVAGPPRTGHDQTEPTWYADTGERAEQFLAAAGRAGDCLIGLSSRATVLNWGRVHEEVTVSVHVVRPPTPYSPFFDSQGYSLSEIGRRMAPSPAVVGEPLVVRNYESPLAQQYGGEWLAFRPDVATHLGWRPHPTALGLWVNERGDVTVKVGWWVDGWYGRQHRSFDDYESDGYTVTLTQTGLAHVLSVFPGLIRTVQVARSAHVRTASSPVMVLRHEVLRAQGSA